MHKVPGVGFFFFFKIISLFHCFLPESTPGSHCNLVLLWYEVSSESLSIPGCLVPCMLSQILSERKEKKKKSDFLNIH